MDLVGRRHELAAIEHLLERATTGAGGVLVVTGPAGSGRTALADAASAAALGRGLAVTRSVTAGSGARLILLDDGAVPDGEDLARLVADGAAVLVTVRDSAPAPPRASPVDPAGAVHLHLGPLTRADLGLLLPTRPDDVVHAIWLATGGLPGPALELAAGISDDSTDGEDGGDPVVALALRAPSRAEFLVPDVALLRLLETAAARPSPSSLIRSRLLIRWARELLADTAAADRRRDLADEAVRLARQHGDAGVLAEVLDGRLHALWDPLAAPERLDTATEIIDLARRGGDPAIELRGLFWRFTALVELGDLDAAEAALVTYARTAELAGDEQAGVVVLSRQAVLALVRGRLDLAATLTNEVAEAGRRAGLAETSRLTASLKGRLAIARGEAEGEVGKLQEMARRLPGHFYEATTARILAETGRDEEALLELDRLLPSVLAGTGPRWLGAVADLAFVAARGGDPTTVHQLYGTLLPYRGRLVVWGGANMVTGPVDDLLGRLANRLDRPAEARAHFDRAVAHEERMGALPWLCATLAVRGRPGDRERSRALAARLGITGASGDDEWQLMLEDDGWHLRAGPESARLNDIRGLHYLRTLVSAPGREVAALDLVAGGAGLRTSAGEPVLDAEARTSYRARLVTLEQRLDAADQMGDADQARALAAERDTLVAELRTATGLGGRVRHRSAEAERARVNATRALATVLTRLETAAPLAAAHLRASLRTGGWFRYQPAAGGPERWRVS